MDDNRIILDRDIEATEEVLKQLKADIKLNRPDCYISDAKSIEQRLKLLYDIKRGYHG